MSRVYSPNIDYTSRDYDAFRELLIEKLTEKIPEYTDTSETDAGIVILESLANGLDILSFYLDVIANDLILETTEDKDIAIMLARMLGYVPYNQTTSYTKQVFVLDELKDIDVIIPAGTVVATESSMDETVEPLLFETVEDLTIPSGSLGNEQDENGDYIYSVDVAQGETIEDDEIGSSDGTAYQKFTLEYADVLLDTLIVYVQTDTDTEEWSYIDSFLDPSIDENSKVFTASIDEYGVCTIQFGNGIRGAIPPEIEDGISCDYRVGGGIASNVSANTITSLDETDLDFLDSTFNPESSYVLGHDMESLEEIKENAPANFTTRERCVTLKDYENIFQVNNTEFYPIWRVKALNDSENPLQANLFVQMREGYTFDEEITESMKDFLLGRVIIGTTYEIAEHTVSYLDLEANLVVNTNYNASEVEESVRSLIESYFSGTNFTFEDTLVSSDLEQFVLVSIDGIEAFRIISPSDTIVNPIEPQAILSLRSLVLNTTGGAV